MYASNQKHSERKYERQFCKNKKREIINALIALGGFQAIDGNIRVGKYEIIIKNVERV